MRVRSTLWKTGGAIAFAILVILLILAPPPSSNEPRFQGRTAADWFEEYLISGYSETYSQAVKQLSTNFFPVFEQARRQYPPKQSTLYWTKLYAKLPGSMQDFLPKPKPLIDPRPLVDGSICRHFSRYSKQWPVWTNDLSSRLRAHSPDRQWQTLHMLAILHSGRMLSASDCRAYVNDAFFPVRFYAAFSIASSLNVASIKQSGATIPEQAASVLREALTNRPTMIAVFSERGAAYWQHEAEVALNKMQSALRSAQDKDSE